MSGPPDREWLKQLRLALFTVVTWFVLSIIGELIGNQANNTAAGQTIGHFVLLVAVIAVPGFLIGWAALSLRERRRRRSPIAAEETPPPPRLLAPPPWHPREPLVDRDVEVRAAVRAVCATGVVAVVGARDIGTSAVGQAVAQRLIDEHGVEVGDTTRFDLRSRSSSVPDDAVTTAGRVVSAFGIDEPADDTDTVLANVATELVAVFRESGGTLVLDNVSTAEQVAWVVGAWPADGPRLVIAGEIAIGDVVEEDRRVEIGPLALRDLRDLWRREMDTPVPRRRWWDFVRRPRTAGRNDEREPLDELLRSCLGRPGALMALVQELRRPGSAATVAELVATLRGDGPVDGPLERVWHALLANMRQGLTADAVRLLFALAQLPVTGLTKSAVTAMLGVTEDPVALEELRIRNLVQEADGRYRLPREIRRVIEGTTSAEERATVAEGTVPALLRFYATLAHDWAAQLETSPRGAAAWFRVSEQSFRPLYGGAYLQDDGLLKVVFDDLCAIADALERWYVRERQSSGLHAVSSGLYGLADRIGRPEMIALTAIRMAAARRMARRLGEAVAHLDDARAHLVRVSDQRLRAELDTRELVERALFALARGGEAGSGQELAALRDRAPRSPTVYIVRAALCLARDEPGEALDHLRRAEELAQELRDHGSQAQAIELRGVALSKRDLIEAVRAWQLARAAFASIGEDQGEARCLQHLGSAAVTDPRAAGQLLRGSPEPLDRREAAEVALTHLERAKALRAGQPNTELVDHYIAIARRHLEP